MKKWMERRNSQRWRGLFECDDMIILTDMIRCFLENIECNKIENSDDVALNVFSLTKEDEFNNMTLHNEIFNSWEWIFRDD
jgi:hypothetical protein